MALDFQNLSQHLRDVLLNLKHMSPMQRFAELSKPRFELKWQTMAFQYGMEKLERQGWLISDQEILNPTSQNLPLMNADNTEGIGTSGHRAIGASEEQNLGTPQPATMEEECPGMRQVQEEANCGLEKMAEAAAMETERTPMPENRDDKKALEERDLKIWHQALAYLQGTMGPKIESAIRWNLGVPMPWEPDAERVAFHQRQLARLTKADAAPRCEHIYTDGTTCAAPKLKTGRWCYAHERMKSVRVTRLRLLPMEDGNSIMLNLMEIQRALVDGEITEKTAGLLMYNQQLGLIALRGVTFKETDVRRMVTELPRLPELPKSPELKSGSPQRVRRTRRRTGRPDIGALEKRKPQSSQGARIAQRKSSRVMEGNQASAGSRSAAAKQAPHLRRLGVNSTAVLPASVRFDARTNPGVESAKSKQFGVELRGRGEANGVMGKPVSSEQSRRNGQVKATAGKGW